MRDGNGHTATVTFTVSVTDIPDETPLFTSHADMDVVNVVENDATGTPIAIAIAGSDADAFAETFTFTITTNPGGRFIPGLLPSPCVCICMTEVMFFSQCLSSLLSTGGEGTRVALLPQLRFLTLLHPLADVS